MDLHFACKILRNCKITGGLKLVGERGLYFLQKQKVAKAFLRFCEAESRVES